MLVVEWRLKEASRIGVTVSSGADHTYRVCPGRAGLCLRASRRATTGGSEFVRATSDGLAHGMCTGRR